MGLGSMIGKLFGGSGAGPKAEAAAEADPVEHNGLYVVASPIKEGGQYRTAGYIEKREGDNVQRTRFIRADNHNARDAAVTHSIQKGKQIIDEQGEAVLSRENA